MCITTKLHHRGGAKNVCALAGAQGAPHTHISCGGIIIIHGCVVFRLYSTVTGGATSPRQQERRATAAAASNTTTPPTTQYTVVPTATQQQCTLAW